MELVAGFTFLNSFGASLRGMTLQCHTDSTSVLGWPTKMWAPEHVMPLLTEIHLILIRLDIRLDISWISSKDNVLADALSRGEWATFVSARKDWDTLPDR